MSRLPLGPQQLCIQLLDHWDRLITVSVLKAESSRHVLVFPHYLHLLSLLQNRLTSPFIAQWPTLKLIHIGIKNCLLHTHTLITVAIKLPFTVIFN